MEALRHTLTLLGAAAFGACLFAAPGALARPEYVSAQGREGRMSFDHAVEFRGSALEPEAVLVPRARGEIEKQLKFMIGSIRGSFAAPKWDHRISEVRITGRGLHPGSVRASYHYEGTLQVRNDTPLPPSFILPNNPSRFYWDGLVRNGVNVTAPCTKKGYRSPSELFYYWHPEYPGCPWKEGRDYSRVQADFTPARPARNDKLTYPEYDRLIDPKTDILTIWLLMGPSSGRSAMDPLVSTDTNAQTFRTLREHFLAQGFSTRRWSTAKILQHGGFAADPPWVETFEKAGARSRIQIHAFFGRTAVRDRSRPFYRFLEEAVENASVVIYAGHAGLGNTLKPSIVENLGFLRLSPDPERYQIYFFNGCSTYPYYARAYFARKASAEDPAGTKNLDIMTTGLATGEDFLGPSSLALIDTITAWVDGGPRTSYRQILERAGGGNLLSVSGDEDNP